MENPILAASKLDFATRIAKLRLIPRKGSRKYLLSNENPVDDSGNSFEKTIKAEIKRDAKRKMRGQRNLKFAMQDSESAFLNPDQFKALRQIASSANTPRPRNGQRQEDVRVPPTPEDQN